MKARLLFLLLSAVVLLAAWKITTEEESALPPAVYQPLEPVTIAVAADLHYLSPTLTDHGSAFQRVIENADGKVITYSEQLMEAFTQQIIAQTPDVLILAGDLTCSGERASHEALARKLRRIADAGVYVLAIPGNHDLENSMAVAFQGTGYQRTESISAMDSAPQNPDLLQKWQETDSFLAAYLQSMTADFGTNFTQYSFSGGTP